MSQIIEAKTSTDVCEKERISESNDSLTNKSNCLDLSLIRRKRKLYSHKFGNGVQQHNNMLSDEEEDNDFKAMKGQTSNYKATSYIDIEEYCKEFEQTPSPRTEKNNDNFDRLKDKIESNNSVIYVDKTKLNNFALYNITSESEDEDLTLKKTELQKRMSPTTMVTSGDSSISTLHGRLANKVNNSEDKSSDETKKPLVTKPKTNIIINLYERIRKVASEEVNTSIILKKPAQTQTDIILPKRPEVEIIPEENIEIETEQFTDRTKNSIEARILSLKKDKSIINKKSNYKIPQPETAEDGKESPLPALLVETIPDKQDDINDSISINMLQKLPKIQQEGPGTSINATNTTQNLLSDIEKIKTSTPIMNIPVDDIPKWLPSSQNSDTDSSFSGKVTTIPVTTKAQIEHYDDNSYEVSKRNKPIKENLGLKERINFDKRSKTSARDQRYSISKSNSIKESKRSDKMMGKALNTKNSPKKIKSGTKMPLVLEHQNSPITNRKEKLTQIREFTISPVKLSDDYNSISQRININYSNNKAIKTDNKLSKELNNSGKVKENIEISSTNSKMSTSTKIKTTEKTLKRKSDSPLVEYGKKRRLDQSEVIFLGNDNRVSIVNEWLRKIAPGTRDESITASLSETVKYILEKLDTTLLEIHHNTSEKFIHMLVNALKHITSAEQKRKEMFRSVWSEIFDHVGELLKAKFADLDQRSQEIEAEFMEKFKSEGIKLIREESNQKQVMVSILREEVEAVLDYIAKTQKDDC